MQRAQLNVAPDQFTTIMRLLDQTSVELTAASGALDRSIAPTQPLATEVAAVQRLEAAAEQHESWASEMHDGCRRAEQNRQEAIEQMEAMAIERSEEAEELAAARAGQFAAEQSTDAANRQRDSEVAEHAAAVQRAEIAEDQRERTAAEALDMCTALGRERDDAIQQCEVLTLALTELIRATRISAAQSRASVLARDEANRNNTDGIVDEFAAARAAQVAAEQSAQEATLRAEASERALATANTQLAQRPLFSNVCNILLYQPSRWQHMDIDLLVDVTNMDGRHFSSYWDCRTHRRVYAPGQAVGVGDPSGFVTLLLTWEQRAGLWPGIQLALRGVFACSPQVGRGLCIRAARVEPRSDSRRVAADIAIGNLNVTRYASVG